METRWHLARVLGLREAKGTDGTLLLDYFDKRGPGGGLELDYVRDDFFGNLQGYVIPQVTATLLPITGFTVANLSNIVLVVGVVTTLMYFYFSKPHRGVLGAGARVGIVFIMISFGASFGYTLMARISLLIGRLHFLFHDLLHILD